MKQYLRKSALLFLPLATVAMTSPAEIVLLDFGSTSYQTSGNWNNITGINEANNKTSLINSEGTASGISLNISTGNFSGTTTYNGNVNADASMFDAFEAASVITDAAWVNSGSTGTLAFGGLDSSLTYNLTIVGARDNPNERFTRYSVSGFGSEVLQTTGDDPQAGLGVNWNNNSVVTINGITGVSSFDLTLVGNSTADFSGANTYSYINALQIEAVPEASTFALLALSGIAAIVFKHRRK
ncbi:hypothetical protein P3T73_08280 [Kiritimatiellota bacterium B12222]|nr:hypothetical protein P3T73_08280 [Kiritimatiellota bacterium B12222]